MTTAAQNKQPSGRFTSPPQIAPAPPGPAPFWSVMIPCYNFSRYLRQALESVLAQDPGPDQMQIEIVDNCSTKDDPAEVLREMKVGDRVRIFRQSRTVPMASNWNTCVERARGRWVHVLHNDDLVLPGFYSRFQQALTAHPETGAAFCRHVAIREDGSVRYTSRLERSDAGYLSDWLARIAVWQRIQCPSIVVRRDVYENLGGFRLDLAYSPDWEMWKRIAVFYPVWYEPEVLAHYRVHSSSGTAAMKKAGLLYADHLKNIEICKSYFPDEVAAPLAAEARDRLVDTTLEDAKNALWRREYRVAAGTIREALRADDSPRLWRGAAVLPFWFVGSGLRSVARRALRRLRPSAG